MSDPILFETIEETIVGIEIETFHRIHKKQIESYKITTNRSSFVVDNVGKDFKLGDTILTKRFVK